MTTRTIVSGSVMVMEEMQMAANDSANATASAKARRLPKLQHQSNGHFEILQTREIPHQLLLIRTMTMTMAMAMIAECTSLLHPLTFAAIELMNSIKRTLPPVTITNQYPKHP
jgi:hypothetical protein